jgi:CheY-like chemotaxis protein
MQRVLSNRESPVPGVILASSNTPENPDERKAKKERAPRAKRGGDRVLVVGRQQELALYRAEILRQAGFSVSIAEDVEAAIRIMQRGAFEAVVLSYTLPSADVQYLADAARDYRSDSAVVVICKSTTVDRRIQPDAIALAEDGPAGLVAALKRVLEGN